MAPRVDANSVVQKQLFNHIRKVEQYFDGYVLSFVGELRFGIDDYIRTTIDALPSNKDRLIVFLETPGGYAEVVQRIADTFRKNFKLVDYIIPNFAMSAGTILAMSGDQIYMDDYSILGPIDPQVESRNGQMVPALGYLKRYEQLLEKSANGTLTTAELNILVDGFDQAELFKYEQAKKLSETLLVDWLVKYKFKDWHNTETRGISVTQGMKERRAQEIVEQLSDTEKWHTHGRGIPKEVLENTINLKIDDFSQDQKLDRYIKEYYHLLKDYMGQVNLTNAIHSRNGFVPLMKAR